MPSSGASRSTTYTRLHLLCAPALGGHRRLGGHRKPHALHLAHFPQPTDQAERSAPVGEKLCWHCPVPVNRGVRRPEVSRDWEALAAALHRSGQAGSAAHDCSPVSCASAAGPLLQLCLLLCRPIRLAWYSQARITGSSVAFGPLSLDPNGKMVASLGMHLSSCSGGWGVAWAHCFKDSWQSGGGVGAALVHAHHVMRSSPCCGGSREG